MIYKKISIIIPLFNEEDFIENTINAVLKSDVFGLRKEIIVVNDGSTDNSYRRIRQFQKRLHQKTGADIKIVHHEKNTGKGAALKKGFVISTGDIVLVQDADCEYDPKDYPTLLEPFINNQADVVYGSRFVTNRPHRVLYFWHYAANIALTFLSNIITNLNITDMETGYKVFRGELIRTIAPKLISRRFGFEPEITARIAKIKGLRIYEVGISYHGRTYQEGKKIHIIDGVKAFIQIIRFSIFAK